MKKVMAVCIVALLAVPLATLLQPASADEGNTLVEVETIDFATGALTTRMLTREQVHVLDRAAAEGEAAEVARLMGLSFDFGFSNLLFSYGKGDVYVPVARDSPFLSPERTFLFRFILRPIIFNYHNGGFTAVKFGANYFWKGPVFLDYGYMLGDQIGMMLGFIGVHIRIPWLLRPDTHIFVGANLLTVGYNKFL
jgi:hypothetical protein